MKNHSDKKSDSDDAELVSAVDELPLWSAPFGLRLLDVIELRKGIRVLDVGCGPGFPLIEIAERLGNTCLAIGIDPWKLALRRAQRKAKTYGMRQVRFVEGVAEQMPFEDGCFDLIVSNNGLNNVRDLEQSLGECRRVGRPNAQLVFTMNLEETMLEFYSVFQDVLAASGLKKALPKLKDHIRSKRKPLNDVRQLLENAGFTVGKIHHDAFQMRFIDGTSMFNHHLIKFWFLDAWKAVLDSGNRPDVFSRVESELNEQSARRGELILTVPFATIDCRRT